MAETYRGIENLRTHAESRARQIRVETYLSMHPKDPVQSFEAWQQSRPTREKS